MRNFLIPPERHFPFTQWLEADCRELPEEGVVFQAIFFIFAFSKCLTKFYPFMKLQEILAISGQSGLYKFVAQSKNGIIVESLVDGRRFNTSAHARVSSLGEIAIYTEGEDLPLARVFETMFAKTEGKETIPAKSSPEALKKLFAEMLPDYDRDRVHVSDIKKVVAWYNILVAAGMTEFKSAEDEAEAQKESETSEK